MRLTRLSMITLAASALAAAPAAAAGPGSHISDCARMALGQRADVPSVTCEHDGMTMTFANFGQMVVHHLQTGEAAGS